MRKNRIIYFSCLGLTVILAIAKAGFISTMLLYMMLLLPLADLFMIFMTYQFFRLRNSLNKKTIVKGEEVVYKLELENNTPFVFAPISIHYSGSELLFADNNLETDKSIVLYPYSNFEIEKDLVCNYRGSYNVGVDKVTITGFLNLFSIPYTQVELYKLLVYPTIHSLIRSHFKTTMSETSESIISFDHFDKSIFSDIREYRPGDPLKNIHWKLSARYDEWVAKEFEGNVNNRTKIFINSAAMDYPPQKNIVIEDYLIEGVVSLSKYLLDNNTPLEMHWHRFEEFSLKGQYAHDFYEFYETLAKMSFEHGESKVTKMIENNTNNQYDKCVLMVFTYAIDAKLSELLILKERQGYEINVMLINPKECMIEEEYNNIDLAPMYVLLDKGVKVYRLMYENGICRLDVA